MDILKDFLASPYGAGTISVVVAIIIVLVIVKGLKKLVPKYIEESASRYRARKSLNLLGFIVILLAILVTFSNELTGVTVFLGVAGAGIAFALQEIIASAAGYIVIHTSSFYKVGDRVQLAGIKGDVIDIGLLRTSLMETGSWIDGDLYNGRITRIANSFVFKEPVFNYSGHFPFVWDEIKVPIKTGCDYEYATKQCDRILNDVQGKYTQEILDSWKKMREKFMIENARVNPFVSLVFDENWITLNLRYVVNYKARRITKDIISRSVLEAVNQSEGRIQIASAAFEITAFPTTIQPNQNQKDENN
jgi:small-conductance mechanosensitive channel